LRWIEVRVTVASEAAEAVGERLVRLGARGYAVEEDGELRVLVAYFPVDDRAGERAEDIRAFLERLPDWGLDPGPAEMTARPVEEGEWGDQWKAYFHPVRIGRRLVVFPPWEKPACLLASHNLPAADGAGGGGNHLPAETPGPGDPEDEWRVCTERSDPSPARLPIEIDPGQAFGTGTHPTTVGALELIEVAAEMLPGRRDPASFALDLGTGSGILAIAAVRLGLPRVIAVDCDTAAVRAARDNARRNGVADRIEVIEGDAFTVVDLLAESPLLVTANITTDLVAALARRAASLLPGGGFFVCSGVSAGEGAERVLTAAREAGLEEMERRTAAGWTSFLFRNEAHDRNWELRRRDQCLRKCDRPAAPDGRAAAQSPPGRVRAALFHTLGCKANLYDTAGMMAALRAAGWRVLAGGGGEAAECEVDLVVVNSCAVTARAEAKSRQLTRRLRKEHPDALVVLVGCYPEINRETAARTTGADLALGTADRDRLPEVVAEFFGDARPLPPAVGVTAGSAPETPPPLPGAFAGERIRATVKVQDGCEQFCTYCVIPYARGPSRSRPAGEVLEEVEALVGAGFKEIVVTGIHLGAWGLDLCSGHHDGHHAGRPAARVRRLADLAREIAAVPGLARVRLSSIEPLEITDDLIDLVATVPRLCRHLHVPLQSGSDEILKRMNRHYTAAQYLAMVERIRARVPLIGLTTDVMVGFPGETDEDFEATLDVVRRARFSRLHVFRFSRRPGTPAADMPGQVPPRVKKTRSERLIRLGRRLEQEFYEGLIGRVLDVLVEKVEAAGGQGSQAAGGQGCPATGGRGSAAAGGQGSQAAGRATLTAEGLTDNYVRVSFPVERCGLNDLVPVRLERAGREGMTGRPTST